MRYRRFSLFLVALAFAMGAGARDLPSHAGKAACDAGPTALCLNGGRFRVEIAWKDFDGRTGAGQASALTDDTGTFWFFDPANLEVTAKVLDGRTVNGNWWFFFGALTNVEYRITLTDTVTGARKIYRNPTGRFASGFGRAWYTALGHRSETFAEASYAQHLLGGILWAAGRS